MGTSSKMRSTDFTDSRRFKDQEGNHGRHGPHGKRAQQQPSKKAGSWNLRRQFKGFPSCSAPWFSSVCFVLTKGQNLCAARRMLKFQFSNAKFQTRIKSQTRNGTLRLEVLASWEFVWSLEFGTWSFILATWTAGSPLLLSLHAPLQSVSLCEICGSSCSGSRLVFIAAARRALTRGDSRMRTSGRASYTPAPPLRQRTWGRDRAEAFR